MGSAKAADETGKAMTGGCAMANPNPSTQSNLERCREQRSRRTEG
jgi:hypothetical protein